jgi:hypothetical protein
MLTLLRAALAAFFLAPQFAFASAVVPLDTFPTSGYPNGPDAGLFARVLDGREIAVPFHLPTSGRITQIETGILGPVFNFECYALSLGIVGSSLIGTFAQLGNGFPWQFTSGNRSGLHCSRLDEIGERILNTADFLTISDLDVFLGPGDYWLVASFIGDTVEPRGGWLTNPDILSDDWALRLCPPGPGQTPRPGGGCDAWATLERRGIDPSAIPAARIAFEPGLRIPEPTSAAASIAALLFAFGGFARCRRSNRINAAFYRLLMLAVSSDGISAIGVKALS